MIISGIQKGTIFMSDFQLFLWFRVEFDFFKQKLCNLNLIPEIFANKIQKPLMMALLISISASLPYPGTWSIAGMNHSTAFFCDDNVVFSMQQAFRRSCCLFAAEKYISYRMILEANWKDSLSYIN